MPIDFTVISMLISLLIGIIFGIALGRLHTEQCCSAFQAHDL
ncbi:MAG TPA: hypothetical protein VJ761_06485 [Ktedonobacteraceae bacterium]|nr:hypothetical protein [Ktedonobacteraceae bacterium]